MAVQYKTQEAPAELSKAASKANTGVAMLRPCTRVVALVRSTKRSKVLDAGGSGGGGFNWMQFVTGPEQGDIFKNIQEKTYTNKRELFGKVFLIKDSIAPTKWVMTGENKKNGKYNA